MTALFICLAVFDERIIDASMGGVCFGNAVEIGGCVWTRSWIARYHNRGCIGCMNGGME